MQTQPAETLQALPAKEQPAQEFTPQHTDDWHRRNDAQALELQIQHFRAQGWM